jgi:hypothetical protein
MLQTRATSGMAGLGDSSCRLRGTAKKRNWGFASFGIIRQMKDRFEETLSAYLQSTVCKLTYKASSFDFANKIARLNPPTADFYKASLS